MLSSATLMLLLHRHFACNTTKESKKKKSKACHGRLLCRTPHDHYFIEKNQEILLLKYPSKLLGLPVQVEALTCTNNDVQAIIDANK